MVTTMSDTKYFPERTLEHGAWKKHKYIRKDGKKYIYKETRELDNGTSQDIYENEETGETIHKNNDFKYDPERPDYRKKAIETAEEVVSKVTDKKDPETGEMTKGDYADEKEEKRKYFVKHSDTVESDDSEYLEHGRFGSFRKAHKYIDRMWKNGKWFYRYKITGKGYKDRYRKYEKASDDDARKIWDSTHKDEKGEEHQGASKDWTPYVNSRGIDQLSRDSARRDKAESDYYDKSLFGKLDKARKYDRFDQEDLKRERVDNAKRTVKSITDDSVKRGKSIINKLLGR